MRFYTVVWTLTAVALAAGACDKSDKAKGGAEAAKTAKPAGGDEPAGGSEPGKMDHAKMGHDKAATDKAATDKPDAPAAAAGAVTAGEHGKAMLAAYEKVRLALAKDDWDGAKAAATAFGEWAKTHATTVDPALAPHLEGIVGAAAKLVTASDIEASRGAPFGDLSKHTIAVVVAAKDLGEGVQVYRCPMAKAYKKWLQLDDEMANPYMGKRMLKCGGKVKTEV